MSIETKYYINLYFISQIFLFQFTAIIYDNSTIIPRIACFS